MNTGTLITIIIGVVIPALVAVVTRENLPEKLKEAILLLLSTATGVISGLATNPPASLSQWEHVLLNIAIAFIAAEAADLAAVKTGVTAAIHRATDNFGWGP